MDCSPQDVFDVLTNGWTYATWVVGAARVRSVDRSFPEVGAKVHHSVGLWPFLISDHTEVEEISEPDVFQLRVKAWPTGEGQVRITCRARGAQTEVVIEERATSGPAALIPGPVEDVLLRVRNTETLRRLGYLAENRAGKKAEKH
jgi:hypothetical protein